MKEEYKAVIENIKDWRPRPTAFQLSEYHNWARHDKVGIKPSQFKRICKEIKKHYNLEFIGESVFFFYFH